MKATQKNLLLKYIARNYPCWITGLDIERLAIEGGLGEIVKGATLERRARELVNEGKLECDYSEGFVRYRFIPEKKMSQEEILQIATQ